MTFDEELTQTVDALTDGLRDEIARQVHAAVAALAASARADREQAVADVRDAAERAAAEQGAAAVRAAAAQLAEAVADAEARAYAFGKEEAEQQLRSMGPDQTSQLRDGMRELDAAKSLSDILNALVMSAALAAERAAIWLVRGDQLHAWRMVGFDGHALEVAIADSGLVAESIKTKTTKSSDGTDASRIPTFAGSSVTRSAFTSPIALAGDVVGVLYADRAAANTDRARDAQLSQILEVLTRHASRRLEGLVAFRTARMVAGTAAAAAPTPPPDTSSDDERAARRYAKLLVSEIRLYHEDEVAAGRRERDLATRLGGEIARARVMYEERVAADVRQRGDFFYEELVRTLANGDPALLEMRA